MINLSVEKISAYDETEEVVFQLEAFDEYTATLEIKTLIAPGESLDELLDAIKRGVDILELKRK